MPNYNSYSFQFLPEYNSLKSLKVETEVLVTGLDGGSKINLPKNSLISQVEKYLSLKPNFSGKSSQSVFFPKGTLSTSHSVCLLGTGEKDGRALENFRVSGAALAQKIMAEKSDSVRFHLPSSFKGEDVHALLEGFLLSLYRFDKYKSNTSHHKIKAFTIVARDKDHEKELTKIAKDALLEAESVFLARDWSNEPSNFGTPAFYASECQKLAKELNVSIRVLGAKEQKKERMDLFLSVGQGSPREGKVVVMEYKPKGARKTIALVGKGVTFDSGGISLKPGLKMEEMKHDMSGAATLTGAFRLAVKRGSNNRVVLVVGFTENMPSGTATQPGNVFNTRAGKTVEVINTDAEGRLILADLLDLAQDFKPSCVLNAATLTGAVGIALGKHCCGVMTNDAALLAEVREHGETSRERMWELPLYDEYLEDMKGDWSDLRNSANDPYGGTIRGGIFLREFIRKGMPWVHLDIANTAYYMSHVPYFPKKGASGMFVRSVAKFVENYS